MRRYAIIFVLVACGICPAVFAQANFGQMLSLDGSSHVYLKGGDIVSNSPNASVELWFYWRGVSNPSDFASYGQDIYSENCRDGGLYKIWITPDSTLQFSIDHSSGGYTNDNGGKVSPNQWYFVTAVLDNASGQKLYVNGNLIDANSNTSTQSSASGPILFTYLGFDQVAGGGAAFFGYIDEVRTWNYARTQAQIQSKMDTTLVGNESGLLGYWRLDGNNTDNSLNGLNGFGFGSPTYLTSTVPYIPNLQMGLVAWYPFNGNANDSSGNGNNGTVSGATLTTDRFGNPGKAYSFNGTNAYISVPNSSSLSIVGDITISAWIYDYGDNGAGYHTVLTKDLSGSWSYNISISLIAGGTGQEYKKVFSGRRNNPTGDYKFSNVAIDTNRWTHLVVTIKNDTIHFFENGVDIGFIASLGDVFTIPMIDQNIGLTIGWNNEAGQWMSGKLDDIRIYSRALNVAEIDTLYHEGGWANPLPTNGLVAYYPFNGNANDESGNGNNGTNNGATLTTDRFGNPNSAYLFSSNIIVNNFAVNFDSISISMWFKTDSAASVGSRLIEHNWPAGSFSLAILPDSTIGAAFLNSGSTEYSANAYLSTLFGRWNHVVAVYDGSTAKLYLNSILCASTNVQNGLAYRSAALLIGSRAQWLFGGALDDIRIYSRALNVAEIGSLYREGGWNPPWQYQLTAAVGSVVDNNNYLGVNSRATDGFDSSFDIPKPPPAPGNYIQLYFPHPEWNSPLGNNFASDIRANTPLSDTVKRWYFQVKTNVMNDTVRLSFVNNGFPSGLGRYLTDYTTGRRINLKNITTYKYFHGADSTARLFMVLMGDSTAPSLALNEPDPSTIWRSGTTRTIQWTARDRTGIDSIFVYSSSNGGSSFTPVASLGFVQSDNWTVPNEYLNNLYAIKVIARDSVGNLAAVRSSQTFTVVGDSLSTTNPVGWSLFSLPLAPNNSSTSSIFGDGSYVYGYRQDSGYVQPTTLALGKGYWLGLLSPTSWFVEGTATESDSLVQPLTMGYSVIGSNYVRPVTKESMSLINAGTEYSYINASSAGLIVNALYQYTSTGYADADTLRPFSGSWIATLQNGVQLVQKPTSTTIAPPTNNRMVPQLTKSKSVAATSYWSLSIQVANGSSTDKIFSVGVEPLSTNGFDAKYDAPRPPRNPGANYLELYTIHTGGNYPAFLGTKYAKDFRDSTGASWNFTVESSKNGTITLSWDKSQLTGMTSKIILVDNGNGQSIDMSTVNTYAFTYSSPHSFSINGTTTKVGMDGASLPTVYALMQNYPNPFNPSTKISYQLPVKTLVTLKVYDIIGREVAALVNEQQNAGIYDVTFDGSRLASGVYFYRIQAGTFTQTKKFVLLK